jgi:Flp pilus assembly protein TadD
MGRLAIVMSIRGKFSKSEQLLRKVIDVDPAHPYAARELVFVEEGLGKPEEALMWAERYLRINPMDAVILSTKGRILVSLNRLEEAEKVLTESLNLDGSREEPYRRLIAIYGLRNDKQKMADLLTQYARILPPNSERRKLVNDQLRKLRGSP